MRSLPITLALFIAVAQLCLSPSAAHAAKPLTLDEVLAAVEAAHPTLESAIREVDKAEGRAMEARGGFDPTLQISGKWAPVGYYDNGQVDTLVRQATPAWGIGVYAGYRLGWGSYPVYKGDLQTLSGGEVRAGIDIPVWRGGPIDQRRANIKQTKIRKVGALSSQDASQLELEREAANAYWTWVAAGQSLRIARDLLAIAERRDAGLNEQAKLGAIERIKLVDNRRLVLGRMAKVVKAEQTFNKAALELSLFLRDGDKKPVIASESRVPDKLPEPVRMDVPSLDDAVARAVDRRPDVAALNAERQAATVETRLARNDMAPKVNLKSFVARDLGDGPAELGPTEWGAGVVLEVPLPLRASRGKYRVAKATLASIDAKRRGLHDKISAEVRKAHVALQAADQSVALVRQQLEATRELADAERIRFREGATELIIVNLRELAVADAANQEVEALADFQRARADFLTATGRSPI